MDLQHSYLVRQAKETQVPIFFEYMDREGWNPGLSGFQAAFTANPHAFLLGFLKRQSQSGREHISCITAFDHNESFGFLGALIVKAGHRGNRYGNTLLREAMKILQKNKSIGLDSPSRLVQYYEKLGFKGAYNITAYYKRGTGKSIHHPNITKMRSIPFYELNDYDKTIFPGGDRSKFLNCWVQCYSNSTLIYKANDKVQGYGVLRKCKVGYDIAPFYADSNEIASELLQVFRGRVELDEMISFGVPQVGDKLEWIDKSQLERQQTFVRMYTNGYDEKQTKKVFSHIFDIG